MESEWEWNGIRMGLEWNGLEWDCNELGLEYNDIVIGLELDCIRILMIILWEILKWDWYCIPLHFVKDQSFCHNLNQASSQNTSLTKVVTFDILIDKMK